MIKETNTGKMKTRNLIWIVIPLTVIAYACNPKGQADNALSADQVSDQEKRIVVSTNVLGITKISRTIDYTATLEPFEEVHLAPASPGRISEIYVEEGDKVKKGQKLFAMDQTQLHQAEIQLSSLKTDLDRLSALLKTGDIAQQQYDQLKTQVELTESNVDFLKKNTVIYSPFGGTVTGKYFENGEMFGGAPNTTAGKAAIVTLMQLNPVKAIVNISEQYYPHVTEGMPAVVTTDVYDGKVYNGKVSLVHPVVNSMTRSFEVEITVPNAGEKLKPGMFVRVSMFLGEEEAYVVPSNVVLQQEGTNNRYVFTDRNGTARRQMVKVGKRFDEMVEISGEGLETGDMLVIQGQTKLSDGDKISVVNQ